LVWTIPVHHFPILFPTQAGTSAQLSDLVDNLQQTGPTKNQRRKNWKQTNVAEWLATIYSSIIIRDVGDDDEEQYSTQVAASLTTLKLIAADVRKVVVEYNAVPVATTRSTFKDIKNSPRPQDGVPFDPARAETLCCPVCKNYHTNMALQTPEEVDVINSGVKAKH